VEAELRRRPGRVSAEEALEFVALAEATLYAITAGHVERNLQAGVGNSRAADVESLVAGGHIDQVVKAAVAPQASSVKQNRWPWNWSVWVRLGHGACGWRGNSSTRRAGPGTNE
jgi:hypothetical protein